MEKVFLVLVVFVAVAGCSLQLPDEQYASVPVTSSSTENTSWLPYLSKGNDPGHSGDLYIEIQYHEPIDHASGNVIISYTAEDNTTKIASAYLKSPNANNGFVWSEGKLRVYFGNKNIDQNNVTTITLSGFCSSDSRTVYKTFSADFQTASPFTTKNFEAYKAPDDNSVVIPIPDTGNGDQFLKSGDEDLFNGHVFLVWGDGQHYEEISKNNIKASGGMITVQYPHHYIYTHVFISGHRDAKNREVKPLNIMITPFTNPIVNFKVRGLVYDTNFVMLPESRGGLKYYFKKYGLCLPPSEARIMCCIATVK